MAVVKMKRKLAYTEFENTFYDIYKDTKMRTEHVSKRRQYWICRPILEIMCRTFDLITELTVGYYKGREAEKTAIVKKAIAEIESLEKPLIVFWNIQEYDMLRMINWAELLRRELRLLNGLLPENEKCEIKFYTVLDRSAIRKMDFLSTMVELHRYCHGKVTHADKRLRYTDSALLVRFIDDALYQVCKANRKIPETKAEYEKRKACISRALTDLHKMNRPMIAYFSIMEYSEQIMMEWSGLLCKEIHLLSCLQTADKKRFSNLK